MAVRIKYRCENFLQDYNFPEKFMRIIAHLFREHFCCELDIDPGSDFFNAEIVREFGNARFTYEHRPGLVDQYCGGTNWTITANAENFISPKFEYPFDLKLFVTDVAWSHTDVDLRMSGDRPLVEDFARTIEPLLREACRIGDDDLPVNIEEIAQPS